MKKFTFKIDRPTGRYRSFSKIHCYIKLSKKKVGYMVESDFLNLWHIKFMIKDETEKCGFKWITLSHKAASLDEGKKWLNQFATKIQNSFCLHSTED